MTDSKPWYLSRTVWASLVAIAASGLGLAGFSAELYDQEPLVDAILQVVTAAAGLAALVGRLQARTQIANRAGDREKSRRS